MTKRHRIAPRFASSRLCVDPTFARCTGAPAFFYGVFLLNLLLVRCLPLQRCATVRIFDHPHRIALMDAPLLRLCVCMQAFPCWVTDRDALSSGSACTCNSAKIGWLPISFRLLTRPLHVLFAINCILSFLCANTFDFLFLTL